MEDCNCNGQDDARITRVERLTDESEVNRRLAHGDWDLLSVGNESVKGGGQRPYYVLGKVDADDYSN